MTAQNIEIFFSEMTERLKERVGDDTGAGVFISIYNGGRCAISSSVSPYRYFDNFSDLAEYITTEWMPNDAPKKIK